MGFDDLVMGWTGLLHLHFRELGAQGTRESAMVFGEIWGGLSKEKESCYSILVLILFSLWLVRGYNSLDVLLKHCIALQQNLVYDVKLHN